VLKGIFYKETAMQRIYLCLLVMALAVAGCDSFSTAQVEATGGSTSASPDVGTPCAQQTFYHDGDGDTFGDPFDTKLACKDQALAGYVLNAGDCNDSAGGIHPGASELCDGVDNNCNKIIDDTTKSWFYDSDGDGYGDPASELPGACNGLSKKYVANGDDCNDDNASVSPKVKESCNGRDDNCNGKIDDGAMISLFEDLDEDGHGNAAKPLMACPLTKKTSPLGDDCNDGDKTIYTNAPELCDNKDNNCNNSTDENVLLNFFKDDDGDGYGAPGKKIEACTLPVGATASNNDCNDDDKFINPGAAEVCDLIDQNCNGVLDENVQSVFHWDNDGDGFGNPTSKVSFACTAPSGMAPAYGPFADCDDTDAAVHPGAPEICDGKDNACTGFLLNEPNSLCEDGDKFTKDSCYKGTCWYEERKVTLSCFNPPEFPLADGYSCSVSYMFGEPSGPDQYQLTVGKDSVTLLMKDVCAELATGKVLRLNNALFLDWDMMTAVWVGGFYTKIIDSFTNKAISGTPGNVTLATFALDFDFVLDDFDGCK
jgi:hypothetical protein